MVCFGRMQTDHTPIIWRIRLDFDRVCRIPQFYRQRQQFNRSVRVFALQPYRRPNRTQPIPLERRVRGKALSRSAASFSTVLPAGGTMPVVLWDLPDPARRHTVKDRPTVCRLGPLQGFLTLGLAVDFIYSVDFVLS